jgi:hypothetical protein
MAYIQRITNMTRTSLLRRLLSGLLFTLILAIAVPSLAQETLPLPAAPEGAADAEVDTRDIIVIIVPLAAQPISPVNNGDLAFNQPFLWTSTGADNYVIKVTVKETGAKFTYKPPFSCTGSTCVSVLGDHTFAMFEKLHDGQHIVWQVISKFGDSSLKSEKATATINEVAQVTPSSPVNGSMIAFDSFKTLTWEGHNSVNNSYQVTVKDTTAGIVVYARLYKNVYNDCYTSCSVEIPDVYDTFTKGHDYQWTVTAIGATGEKVRSAKASFTLN